MVLSISRAQTKPCAARAKLKAWPMLWKLALSDAQAKPDTRRFLDGLSARSRSVVASSQNEGLSLYGDGIERLWPWASLKWADKSALRITSTHDDDARLELLSGDVDAWLGLAPQLGQDAARNSLLKLVGGLTVAAAGVFALVFFGIPAAAVPLARLTPASVELQLADSIEAQFRLAFKTCQAPGSSGAVALKRVGDQLAAGADLGFPIDIRVTNVPIINAFALPGGRVWVTRGLLNEAESPDELAAVLSHEIAHVENHDVLVNVYRALGFGLILDAVVGGGSGAGQQLVMLGANVTDMKHSRDVEARSDLRGMQLLNKAGLDSRGMAVFFGRLAEMEGDSTISKVTGLVASHPASVGRANIVRAQAKAGQTAMTPVEWQSLRQICNALDKKKDEDKSR
jgi:beta-barrel assembly-enhancing protease